MTSPLLDLCEFPVYRRSVEIVRGEGSWLMDRDGKRYLDMYGGHAVALFGYGDARLVQTLTEAAQTLMFQSNAVEVPVRRTAARALSQIYPGGPWSVLFVNSGAEANENALRLAMQKTGRPVVLAIEGGFHGRTAAAAAVTAGSAAWYGFPQHPFEVRWLPVDQPNRVPELLDSSVGAVIVESVQGVAGARDLSFDLLAALQKRADEVGAWVIADEVQAGMGRTGQIAGYEETPIRPHLVTLGKAIAGGFPAAAVLAKPEVAATLNIGQFGTTFGGGPMACALVAEVACRLSDPDLLARVRERSEKLRARVIGKRVISTQGRGYLLGLRTIEPAKALIADLLAAGVFVGDAKDPHIVRLLPPLTLSEDEIEFFLEALAKVGNA